MRLRAPVVGEGDAADERDARSVSSSMYKDAPRLVRAHPLPYERHTGLEPVSHECSTFFASISGIPSASSALVIWSNWLSDPIVELTDDRQVSME